MKDFAPIEKHIRAYQLQRSVEMAVVLAEMIVSATQGVQSATRKVARALAGRPRALN